MDVRFNTISQQFVANISSVTSSIASLETCVATNLESQINMALAEVSRNISEMNGQIANVQEITNRKSDQIQFQHTTFAGFVSVVASQSSHIDNLTSAVTDLAAFETNVTDSLSLGTTLVGSTPVPLVRDTLVTTVDVPSEYNILFSLVTEGTFVSDYRNIFWITLTETNSGTFGDRVPGVFVTPDQFLRVRESSTANPNANPCDVEYQLEPSSLYDIRMSMLLHSTSVREQHLGVLKTTGAAIATQQCKGQKGVRVVTLVNIWVTGFALNNLSTMKNTEPKDTFLQ